MKRTLRFAPLVLGLALLLAPARPSSAAETSTVDRLLKEGWTLVSPNVLQRTMGGGKVETIGFGVEGLRFKIDGMKKDLASFKESLRRDPDPQLRKTVQAYRAEIKRLTRNLALMAEADQVTAKAGLDCTINYGAHADAFPLGNGTQGVAASADSYFNNNCTQHDQQGEVWVTTSSEASNASGVFTRSFKTDPAAGADAPYIGFAVRAASATSVTGIAQCFSYAYASLTSYAIGVVYEQRAENRLCPAPFPMTVALDGPTSIMLPSGACVTPRYIATVSGGTAPYTYRWTLDNNPVGPNDSVFNWPYCAPHSAGVSYHEIGVKVTDNSGQIQSASITVTINVY
jgi:hypothetical protein